MISLHLEVAFHSCKTIDKGILPKDCSSSSSAKAINEFKAELKLSIFSSLSVENSLTGSKEYGLGFFPSVGPAIMLDYIF